METVRKRKAASLFDAVAGRVGYEGFIAQLSASRARDTPSTSTAPVPPEDVLFRREGAPARFKEQDVYEADRYLAPGSRLPDADLLKAIHAYVVDFYSRTVPNDEQSHGSLDETALLALGVLLEEAAAAALGKSGDLAFVENPGDSVGSDIGDQDFIVNDKSRRTVPQSRRVHG